MADVYFTRDIERALTAVAYAGRDGSKTFDDAVIMLALQFGINVKIPTTKQFTSSNPMIYQIEAGD